MLSVIIPARKEPYVNETIQSVLDNARGDIEVIVSCNYGPPPEITVKDSRVVFIHKPDQSGMRAAMNVGIALAQGDYLMKLDAHCAVGEGFDIEMTKDFVADRIMVPRCYSLDDTTWKIQPRRRVRDYFFFYFPIDSSHGWGIGAIYWAISNYKQIDETMAMQESCWVVDRDYFLDNLFPLDDRPETYGGFVGTQLEIGLKYWLNGGGIYVNKNTWYAHLSKRKHHYQAGMFDRKYKEARNFTKHNNWTTRHWMDGKEPGLAHDLAWLIDKFNPPGWENWQDRWDEIREKVPA